MWSLDAAPELETFQVQKLFTETSNYSLIGIYFLFVLLLNLLAAIHIFQLLMVCWCGNAPSHVLHLSHSEYWTEAIILK